MQKNRINIEKNRKDELTSIKLIELLRSQGYAIIQGHSAPTHLASSLLKEWRRFFDGSEKHLFTRQDTSDEGYIPINVETAKKGKKADYKELYQAHYKSILPEVINTKETSEIFDELVKLGDIICGLIDLGFSEKKEASLYKNLHSISSGCYNHILRIIHYPPIVTDLTKVRAEAHTDICLFTFIFGELFSGLELQDMKGNWHTIDCDPNDIVIFTSEMLEICTNKYLQAVNHRVPTNLKTCHDSRYSISFGYHPYREAMLSGTLTAGSYLRKRLLEMGYDGMKLNLQNY